MPIEINELETKRFGIFSARVVDPSSSPAAIAAEALAQGVRFLTVRLDVADLPRVHSFEAAGFRLMDTLVFYDRRLEDLPPRTPAPNGVMCRLAVPEDAPAVAEVAQAGFQGYMGHYHADPRLDHSAADAAYVEWAATSTSKASLHAPVLLAGTTDSVAGFLALHRTNEEEFNIVLNAVRPAAQRKGIYAVMLIEALYLARSLGAVRMVTSTQINNYAVQRVWSRLGFVHCRSLYTFHKWF